MEEFEYNWIHIPTGKTDKSKMLFMDRIHFLESLNNWNRIGFGLWQYWE